MGASAWKSSSSNPWMKDEFSKAAGNGPIFWMASVHFEETAGSIRTLSCPQIEQLPADSMERTAFTAVSDHGNRDPMIAHAIPSRMRYFVLVTTSSGISDNCRLCTHSQSSAVTATVDCSDVSGFIVRFDLLDWVKVWLILKVW